LRRALCGNEVNVPELPEVETVKRGLEPALLGRRFAHIELRRKDLRFPFPEGMAEGMTGATVEALERRAKYILVHCSNGKSLILHLGMTGRFTVEAAGGERFEPGAFYHVAGGTAGLGPHDHVIWRMDDGARVIYNDARRFGFMDWAETQARDTHKLLRDIGVEPLGNAFHVEHMVERFRGKTAPMKAALLDQRVVAGLGNIYVSEALHRAHISPKLAAGRLVKKKGPDPRLGDLVRHVRDILNEAIVAGGSTLQDYRGVTGAQGEFQQRFRVYDREGEHCSTTGCQSMIKRIVQSGRSTFYCPTCQK
jgi:formamidopyrimidine-DNA glycosylase